MSQTIAEAVAEMGLRPDDEHGVRALVRIPEGGKPVHSTVSQHADRLVTDLKTNSYVTAARYKPGSITAAGGRTIENCVDIDEIAFDADLKDFLGVSKDTLQAMSHEDLDGYIAALTKQVKEICHRVGIPVHRITCTGYGILVSTRLHPDDRARVHDILRLHKGLVGRANACFGGVLFDPTVSDAPSRLQRLVNTLNHKGPIPREIYQAESRPGSIRVDDFPVDDVVPHVNPRPVVGTRSLTPKEIDDLLLAVRNDYVEGSRHAIALGLTAMLVKSGVPQAQTNEILERLADDDEEIDNRLEAINDTYRRVESGQPISGYMALRSFLSADVLAYVDSALRQPAPVITVNKLPTDDPFDVPALFDPPPEECFYGWFGAYRDLHVNCTEGAEVFHLASALTYAGLTIGRRAGIEMVDTHYPALFTVLVGDTGQARKDTCANMARKFFAGHYAEGTAQSPPPYSYLFTLSTPEGILQHMATYGSTMMVHTSEYNQLLGKSRRESSRGLLPQLTALWDLPPQADLPTRKDPLLITNPTVAMLATITPDMLAEESEVNDIRSGYCNRQLFVYGKGQGTIANPPPVDRHEARRLLTEFRTALEATCGTDPERTTLLVKTPRASRRWAEWYEVHHAAEYLPSEKADLSRRIPANIHRVAVILAVADGATAIDVPHIDAAIAYVSWCFDQTALHVRTWGANDEARLAERIKTALKAKPMLQKDLDDASGNRWGPYRFINTLEALVKLGHIRRHPDGLLTAVA